jgi:hypothetical protein
VILNGGRNPPRGDTAGSTFSTQPFRSSGIHSDRRGDKTTSPDAKPRSRSACRRVGDLMFQPRRRPSSHDDHLDPGEAGSIATAKLHAAPAVTLDDQTTVPFTQIRAAQELALGNPAVDLRFGSR